MSLYWALIKQQLPLLLPYLKRYIYFIAFSWGLFRAQLNLILPLTALPPKAATVLITQTPEK